MTIEIYHEPIDLPPLAGSAIYALSFDGIANFLEYTPGWAPSTDLTVSFWINIRDTSVADAILVANMASTGSTVEPRWSVRLQGNKIFHNLDGESQLIPVALDANRWYHVAVVWIGWERTVNTYIDAILVNAYTGMPDLTLQSHTSRISIGGVYNEYCKTRERLFNGLLDNVNLWTRGLTAAEVSGLRTTTPSGDELDLHASWDMNSGTNALLVDDSTGNMPMTMGNGVRSTMPLRVTSTIPVDVTVGEDVSVDLPVQLRGIDTYGEAITAVLLELPANGNLYQTTDGVTRGAPISSAGTDVANTDGYVLYEATGNIDGCPYDEFLFTVRDAAQLATNNATMTIHLPFPNATAAAVSVVKNGTEHTDLTISLQHTSSFCLFGLIQPRISKRPTRGTLYQTQDGVTRDRAILVDGTGVYDQSTAFRVIYVPDQNEFTLDSDGAFDSFEFTFAFATSTLSEPATATIDHIGNIQDDPISDFAGFALDFPTDRVAVAPKLGAAPESIEFWMRTTSTKSWQYVMGGTISAAFSNQDFGWRVIIRDGTDVLFRPGKHDQGQFSWNNVVTANSWYHVAIVKLYTDEALLYINGVYVDRRNGNSYMNEGAEVSIGGVWNQFFDNVQHGYRGQLDELRVWKTRRTAQQIATYYRVSIPDEMRGHLILYYALDEGVGSRSTALHGSGNKADLRLGSAFAVDHLQPIWVNSGAEMNHVATEEDTPVAIDLPFSSPDRETRSECIISALPSVGTLYEYNATSGVRGSEIASVPLTLPGDGSECTVYFEPLLDNVFMDSYDSFQTFAKDTQGASSIDSNVFIDTTSVNDLPVVSLVASGLASPPNEDTTFVLNNGTIFDVDALEGNLVSIRSTRVLLGLDGGYTPPVTVQNGWGPPPGGYAMYMRGGESTHLLLPHPFRPGSNGALTVEFWVKFDFDQEIPAVLLDKGLFGELYICDDGVLCWRSSHKNTCYHADYGDFHVSKGVTGLTFGRWHHVAYVFDPSKRTKAIYLDGLLDVMTILPDECNQLEWNQELSLPTDRRRPTVCAAGSTSSATGTPCAPPSRFAPTC